MMNKNEMSPLEAATRYAAMGPDFLTWLLVRILTGNVPVSQVEPMLRVDLEGPLVFVGDSGEARKVTLAGSEAESAPEVASVLRQGKKLVRARIVFVALEDRYVFVLNAETFDVSGVKLPVPAMSEADKMLEMRMEAHARLNLLLDELFDGFLRLRLDPEAWKAEAGAWKAAAMGGEKQKRAADHADGADFGRTGGDR